MTLWVVTEQDPKEPFQNRPPDSFLFFFFLFGCAGSSLCLTGFSCPAGYGILVPQPGTEPTSPALKGRFLTSGLAGKPLHLTLGESKTVAP